MFEMATLPYNMNELEPYVSQQTFEYHYGKHYKNYVDTLNKLIAGTEFENMTLEEIIGAVYGKPEYQTIFNNAGQVFNHQFFWKSMKPHGGGKPDAKLLKQIEEQFGSYENFAKEFKNAALTQFGSGWAWLVSDNGELKVTKTSNADTPIAHNQIPIIGIDVWEHAYYLDYQNRRADFVDIFLNNLVSWPQN